MSVSPKARFHRVAIAITAAMLAARVETSVAQGCSARFGVSVFGSSTFGSGGPGCGVAGPPAFTDDPLQIGVTPIRAVHIVELRARVNALRTRYGLGAYEWSNATLAAQQSALLVVHISELRAALRDAYVAAGRTPPEYTDPALIPGQTIAKAIHVTELRAAVVALE